MINFYNKLTLMKKVDNYIIDMSHQINWSQLGRIYSGTDTQTGQQIALKIINIRQIQRNQEVMNLFKQARSLRRIRGENVATMQNLLRTVNNFYVISEFYHQNLEDLMKKNKNRAIPQVKAKQYLLQLANGFLTLVREGIIYKTIKPQNVIIKDGILKINDYGFGDIQYLISLNLNHCIVSIPHYVAPEILCCQAYSSKCDIWSLGCIFYETLHAKLPWTAYSIHQLISNIKNKPLELNNTLQQNTKDFLRKCLAPNQKDRISWDQLFMHPIFNNYFIEKANGNLQFQNKLKRLMNSIRFEINTREIDLNKKFTILGYKNRQDTLCKVEFYKLLKTIVSAINQQNSNYIFSKIDKTHKEQITVSEIIQLMNQNNIHLGKDSIFYIKQKQKVLANLQQITD